MRFAACWDIPAEPQLERQAMKSVQQVTTEHNGASRRRPGLVRSKM
jgi:hypothetical protein